ncbi:MAG: hypothetical protein VB078_11940 [Clostridiaceae bacterium]|nr:hypothetical protein [Clostridiaceae bacterium]
MTDNITQRLEHDLDAAMQYDPHNDREAVQGTFNILWLEGFCPEISYLNEEWQQILSIEEAEERYSRRFSDTAKLKGLNLRYLLEQYSRDASILVDNVTSLAMIKASDCHS